VIRVAGCHARARRALRSDSGLGSNSISLPNPRESAVISEDLGGVSPRPNRLICRYFFHKSGVSPVIRVNEVPGSNPGAPIDLID
jgi:hypothetical protein